MNKFDDIKHLLSQEDLETLAEIGFNYRQATKNNGLNGGDSE